MHEIEAKFINIDYKSLVNKLANLGFSQTHPQRLLRRQIFHLPNDTLRRYARVRDEGDDQITLTVKIVDSTTTVDGVREAETTITNFDEGIKLLTLLGWQASAYQETHRELWEKDNVQIMIDEWPGVPPFIEIESDNEADVIKTAQSLGFNWQQAIFGTVDQVFKTYWQQNCEWINFVPKITFDTPLTKDMAELYKHHAS